MEATNENIRLLLEMLDNPDAYTEQEIQDIINGRSSESHQVCRDGRVVTDEDALNRDEDTREAYRFMVEAKRSSRHRQSRKPVDVDAAWQRFESEKLRMKSEESFKKIAASFIGVLLVSGIAFAAIHIMRQYQKQDSTQTADTTAVANSSPFTLHSSLPEDTVIVQPVIYDNISLEKMLPEIAAHYDAQVIFADDEVRELRFRFVWNPQQGIDQVIRDLNQFEHVTVTLNDNLITVE